jgi:hypothetical protein
MTLGNWFSPENPLQVLDAAVMSLNTISLAIAWERRVSKGTGYFKQIECSAFAEYQRLSIRLSWSAFQNSEHLSVYSLMIYQLRRSEPNVSQASLRYIIGL